MFGFKYLGGLEKLLVAAVIATVAVLLIERLWFKTSVIVTPGGDYPLRIEGDQASDGNSVVEWIDRDRFEWRCRLQARYEYPYCFAQVALGGLNLEKFDSIRIDLDYEGPADSIRMQLLNRGSSNVKPGSPHSVKYQELEISALSLDKPLELPMRNFHVASWWLQEFSTVPEEAKLELHDVVYAEILTGTGAPLGEHRFKLNSIEWHGSLVPRDQWYLGIIIAWVSLIIGHLVYRAWYLKTAATRHYERAKHLLARYNSLNIKSRQLEKMAKTDPLTGISNRADISEFLSGATLERRKPGGALSAIMIDIDHFKQINDTYGHDMGDKILIAVAGTLAETVRRTDGVGRWGGEEFLLVCPNTTLEDAEKLAEKLCRQVRSVSIDPQVTVTASFGVATWQDESIEAFVRRVDGALYQAKDAGRNCVRVAR
jgi:diguanylate cyclase (GGDEF)-like protein